jgi:hypothetical protein
MSTDLIIGRSPINQPHHVEPRRMQVAALLAIAAAPLLTLPFMAASAADMPVKTPAARTYNGPAAISEPTGGRGKRIGLPQYRGHRNPPDAG